MDRPALRRVLIELIGTARVPALDHLTAADWTGLDRIAAEHRLQPLLHARHRGNPLIPPHIAVSWQARHRVQALEALVQQAELAETATLLERAGFPVIALKGAWLAVQAYPEAALRPLRDLDLLVDPAQVIPAFEALLAAGYTPARPAELTLAEMVRLDKHMPPLIAPRGTVVELHHRLWEHDGRLDHASPASDAAALQARSVSGPDGLRYLAPQDLLVHLIVHAVYSHRLDCGPLVLADIDYLLRTAPIDWARFWAEAQAQGWRDGARLLLELTARYCPNSAIDFSLDRGEPAPEVLIETAADLLLQDLDTRASAGFAAAALIAGPARLAQRLAGRHRISGAPAVTRQMASEGGWLGWAGSRTLRSLRDLARSDTRRQSRQLAELSQWLGA